MNMKKGKLLAAVAAAFAAASVSASAAAGAPKHAFEVSMEK